MRCNSCQLARINGVLCHERGCPDAWRTELRECAECGADFTPQERHQTCCDANCNATYHGYDPPDYDPDDGWDEAAQEALEAQSGE